MLLHFRVSVSCETHRTMNTRNIFEMLLCSEKKANKKVSGFKVCSRVLNFIVIGHYTINSPDIFQKFTVF